MSTMSRTTVVDDAPPPGGDAVIALRGVTKRFGSHTVLKDLTFDIPRGKISAVLGPSGTGKSVLLKNIIGLLRPEEGQIYVDGEPIVGIRHRDILRIRRKFGVLFQDGALFGSMNIFDNIAFPLREHTNRSEREIKALVMEKAEMVGMVAHLDKVPGEISGGMRKRAGLARALILDPEIVFFDEPDSGLDPVRVAYLDDLVKSVQRETGCTFFIITHNIDSVKRTADYIGMLYRSSLVRFGPAEDMFVSDRALVKQFLAGSAVGPIGMDEMVDAARGEADVAALLADEDPGAGGAVPHHEDGHLDDGWSPGGNGNGRGHVTVRPAERTEQLPRVGDDADTEAVAVLGPEEPTAVTGGSTPAGRIHDWAADEAGHGTEEFAGSDAPAAAGPDGPQEVPEPQPEEAATASKPRAAAAKRTRRATPEKKAAKPRTPRPRKSGAATPPPATSGEDAVVMADLDEAERRQLEEEEALFRERFGS